MQKKSFLREIERREINENIKKQIKLNLLVQKAIPENETIYSICEAESFTMSFDMCRWLYISSTLFNFIVYYRGKLGSKGGRLELGGRRDTKHRKRRALGKNLILINLSAKIYCGNFHQVI